jgi:hypothetical protein
MTQGKTCRQLRQEIKELMTKLDIDDRKKPIESQDIVSWLIEQNEAPHPLATSIDTMMSWLEAMDLKVSKLALRRHVGPVMQLWREQGIPNETFTEDQQEQFMAQRGPNMRPVVLTTTWQQYMVAKENREEEKRIAAPAIFSMSAIRQQQTSEQVSTFRSHIPMPHSTTLAHPRSTRPHIASRIFSRPVFASSPIIDRSAALDRSAAVSPFVFGSHTFTPSAFSRSPTTPPLSEERMVPMSPSPPDLRVRRFYHAPGPLPDLFPGYENPWKAARERRPSADGHEPELP